MRALSCLVVAFASTVAAQTPDTAGQLPPQRDLMDIARKVLGGGAGFRRGSPGLGAESSG